MLEDMLLREALHCFTYKSLDGKSEVSSLLGLWKIKMKKQKQNKTKQSETSLSWLTDSIFCGDRFFNLGW